MNNQKFSIPRYLGLKNIQPINENEYDVTLGFSKEFEKTLVLDLEGIHFLKYFLRPHTIEQAAEHFKMDKDKVISFVHSLKESHILKEYSENFDNKYKRYDRHLLFYDMLGCHATDVQDKISKAKVGLIGMGGIGNWVSLGLIGAGLKELRLIDFDTIELSNLTRQVLFDENDISKSKIEVAQKKLQSKNSDTQITSYDLKITCESELEQALNNLDFVVLSADTPSNIHNWLDHVAKRKKIPYLNAGYRDGIGVVGPLTVHGKTSCYECFKPKNESKDKFTSDLINDFNSRYQAPSFGPINAIVSNIAVLEVMKYIGQFGDQNSLDVEININAFDLNLEYIHYQRDENCWHCHD